MQGSVCVVTSLKVDARFACVRDVCIGVFMYRVSSHVGKSVLICCTTYGLFSVTSFCLCLLFHFTLFFSFDSGKGRIALMGTRGGAVHITSVDARTVVFVLQNVLKNEHVTSLQ